MRVVEETVMLQGVTYIDVMSITLKRNVEEEMSCLLRKTSSIFLLYR